MKVGDIYLMKLSKFDLSTNFYRTTRILHLQFLAVFGFLLAFIIIDYYEDDFRIFILKSNSNNWEQVSHISDPVHDV